MFRLWVHERTIVGSEGAHARSSSVFCPYGECSVPFETCKACERFSELSPAAPDRPAAVVCAKEIGRFRVQSSPRAGELMNPEALCIRDDVRVDELKNVGLPETSSTPVVGPLGELVGMVRPRDLGARKRSATVAEVMTGRSAAAMEQASVSEAAAIMAGKRVRRLPILALDGSVIGVVDDLQLLRWIARIGKKGK